MGRRFVGRTAAWIIIICMSFSQAVFAQEVSQGTSDSNMEYLKTVMEMIKSRYGGEISDEQLVDGALKGIFNSMDQYTTYFTKEEAEGFLGQIIGEYDGIGISMEKKGDFIEVTEVFPLSPAEKAGVYAGDRIVSVDGASVAPASLEEVGNAIKGLSDTFVVLGIKRGAEDKVRSIEVLRGSVTVNPVEYNIKGDTAYIRINIFNSNTSWGFLLALNDINSKGIEKVILDLRGNPGGEVSQAVAVARSLVPKGLITRLDFRSDAISDEEYYSNLEDKKFKLAVLVNEMSASASEILAGAIQDTDAGTLIGTKTFGKAKVQSIIPILTAEAYKKYDEILGTGVVDAYDLINVYGISPLEEEIDGYAKITTGVYTTPKGRMIDLEGLTPDIAVNDPELVKDIDVNSVRKLRRTVKYNLNSEGSDIYNAEKILKLLGYNVSDPDSKMDIKTYDAIKLFQKKKGGCPYGVMDFTTQKWLNDELDKLIPMIDKQYAAAVETLKK